MRSLAQLLLLTGILLPVQATTLQHLPLEEMARQSTAIVRAKVYRAGTSQRKGGIYTVYRLDTLEQLKTQSPALREFAVPGGIAGGFQQVVEGAPALRDGAEYVLFLWTSRSGLTQVIGLSQGVFLIEARGASEETLVRHQASGERMVDAAGQPVQDIPYAMPWSQWKTKVTRALDAQAGRR